MTALLSAFIRSKKMKSTWKIADSTSRAYKRGVIIGGWHGTGEHPLAKLKREKKAKEKKNESSTIG